MATSGTVTAYAPNRTDIIRQAALNVSAVAAGVSMQAQMTSDFSAVLNGLLAQWSIVGIKVWTTREGILFPVSGQRIYTLGHGTPAENDHCCDADDMVETALAIAASATDTTVTVDDDEGIANGDQIGIMLDSGDFFWTTVSGAPVANVVTLAAAITGAAAIDAKVYSYTSNISKPIRITEARRISIENGYRTPFVHMYSRKDFMELPDATTPGLPYAPWYNRQIAAGYLNLIPPPANPLTDLIGFTWHRGIEDFTDASDQPDLPKEWARCLIWNLSKELLPRFPVNAQRRDDIIKNAMESLDAMAGVDREEESVYFQPEPAGMIGYPWGSG